MGHGEGECVNGEYKLPCVMHVLRPTLIAKAQVTQLAQFVLNTASFSCAFPCVGLSAYSLSLLPICAKSPGESQPRCHSSTNSSLISPINSHPCANPM